MGTLACFILFTGSVALSNIDIVEIENLSKQKNPDLAVAKIVEGLKNPLVDQKSKMALQKISAKIFETFYTEKGLNYYEIGRHLAVANPSEAERALARGLELEPYNGKIFLLWARLNLSMEKCGLLAKHTKFMEAFSNMPEVQLLIGQDLACQEKQKELEAWLIKSKDISGPLKKYFLNLWLRFYAQKNDRDKIRGRIEELRKEDSSFPELYFWDSVLIDKDLNRKRALEKKYYLLCMNRDEKQKREHLMEPTMCGKAAEIKKRIESGT